MAQVFAEFLRLCDEASDHCALSGPDGAETRFNALAAALRATPLVFPSGGVYSYDFLVDDAASAMAEPETWGGPNGYGAYFAFLADAVGGDQAAVQQAAAVRAAIQQRPQRAASQRADYDNTGDAFYGNRCADVEFPRAFARYSRIALTCPGSSDHS